MNKNEYILQNPMNRLTVIYKDLLEPVARNPLVWLFYHLLVVSLLLNILIHMNFHFETIFLEDDASTVVLGMDQLNPPTPNLTIKEIVKSLIDFIASR